MILAGIGAVRANASAQVARLAETIGCPVVVAPMAKGIVAEDHPLYAGTLDMACQPLMWKFLAASDLIVAAGFDAVELIKPWSLDVEAIHVDTTPNTDQIYPADLELVGPIGAILDALAPPSPAGARWPEADIRAHQAALRGNL